MILEIVKFNNRLYGVRKTIPEGWFSKRYAFLQTPVSTDPKYLREYGSILREWDIDRDTWIKTGANHLDLCGFQTYPNAVHALNRILDKYDIGKPVSREAQ